MDRKQHWEDLYSEKSPQDVSWYQAEPTLSLELIAATGVTHDAAIIDVGGGASVLVDRLLALGYKDLSVLDVSATALAHAQARLGERAARMHWLEADITAFQPERTYDVWHDRAVFHFLTDAADRGEYVEVLRRGVKPNGHIIIASFAIGGPTRCSGLEVVQYDAEKLGAMFGANFRLVEARAEVHLTPAAKEQNFGYFHFVRT